MSASFRLIFRGQIAPDSDRDAAASYLARRFRLDPAMVEKVMSGRKVALARALTEAQAFSLQAELDGVGLVTRIEADPDAPKLTLEPKAAATQDAPEQAHSAANETPAQSAAPFNGDPAMAGTEDPAMAVAMPVSSSMPCRQCHHELASGSSFCPWCGARQGSRVARTVSISVALLLMLAAIGIPLYFAASEAIQARGEAHQHVAAAMARSEALQADISSFIERTNFWPNSNLDAGLPPPQALADDSLSRVTIGNQAIISLTFREELAGVGGHTLMFVPASDSGRLPRWECRGGTLPADWLPADCEPPEPPPAESDTPQAAAEPLPAIPEVSSDLPPANYLRRVLTQELEQSEYIRDKMIAWQRRHGRWPDQHAALDLADPLQLGSYAMRRVQVNAGGELLFEFSTALENMEGRQLILRANADGSRWECDSDLPATHLPIMCQQ